MKGVWCRARADGGHKYALVEDCEISFTADDLYAHWPQATYRPGFLNKHDPRDCSDHIIFRNNIGRYPRFGTNPSTICAKDCSSHANPCFSLCEQLAPIDAAATIMQ